MSSHSDLCGGHTPSVHQGCISTISTSFLFRTIYVKMTKMYVDSSTLFISEIREHPPNIHIHTHARAHTHRVTKHTKVSSLTLPDIAAYWSQRQILNNSQCSRYLCFSSVLLIFLLVGISRTTLSCLSDIRQSHMICFDQWHVNRSHMYFFQVKVLKVCQCQSQTKI